MESTRKDIIVKGRFNVWDLKDYLSILIFITLIAIGGFLFTSVDLQQYSYYPIGLGVLFLLFLIVRFLFLGNFQLSRFNIIWKTIAGSIKTVSIEEVGDTKFEYSKSGKPSWLLLQNNGKKLKKFRSLSPISAAGAVILFFRYKDELPESVFMIWKPLSKGKRTYLNVQYQCKIDGTLASEAQGFIVLYENKLLFIPTLLQHILSDPEKFRLGKAGIETDLTKYDADGNIGTHSLIEAILNTNLPPAIRDAYLQRIVNENSGHIFTDLKRNGKQWQFYNEGVEILITRP